LIPRETGPFGGGALELRNPLSEDHLALRPTLLSGLLDVLARNVRAGASSIRLFELGHVFSAENAAEKRNLAFVFSGSAESNAHWRSASRRLDLFDLKGVIETIGIADLSFRRSERPRFSLSADILSGSAVVGFLGQLAAASAKDLGALEPVLMAEIVLRKNVEVRVASFEMVSLVGTPSFREIEKFPSVTRDIAMIVPEKLSHAEIMATIEGAREPLLARIELFDLFSGKEAASLGAGKKSLAYTLTYRDRSRTLTSEEVTAAHAKIRERLQHELSAELRE